MTELTNFEMHEAIRMHTGFTQWSNCGGVAFPFRFSRANADTLAQVALMVDGRNAAYPRVHSRFNSRVN